MRYRKDDISVLGYGCMRFTRKGGGIDIDKAEREILRAVELGVTYFDTAYIYPGSETALGEIFERNGIREKVKIATKLPHYMAKSMAAVEKFFEEELKRLRTDHVDYYLMHHLTDISQWERLVSMGIEDWIAREKERGRIRNIGFSFHGNYEGFEKIIEAYDWDICLIQYNYMDEDSQAGRRGLELAASKDIPVVIMEPLRGGKLVNMLPERAKEIISDAGYEPADLALGWLWDQPGVTCVLSGMNSVEMVEKNVAAASGRWGEEGNLTDGGRAVIQNVKKAIAETVAIGCTECGYCMPCPFGVDIPSIFRCYNRMYTEGRFAGRKEYIQTVALTASPGHASLCKECGKCEKHCPQHLSIREELKRANKGLRPPAYRIAGNIGRRVMLRR